MKFQGVSFGMISTWWAAANGVYLHADQHAIVFSPNFATDQMMFVGNDGGIAVTTNPFAAVQTNPCTGTQSTVWTQKNDGYSTLLFYHGSVSPSGTTSYVGGAQDNGVWKYGSGNTWSIGKDLKILSNRSSGRGRRGIYSRGQEYACPFLFKLHQFELLQT